MDLKKVRLCVAACFAAVLTGCVSNTPEVRRTQVVTFPEGGIIEYNGVELGKAPAMITLPQNEHHELIGRAVVRAIPREPHREPATRVFEPGERKDRVPDRIVLDLTGYQSTNFVHIMRENPIAPPPPRKPKYTYTPRSKPTQVIGID